MTQHIGRAAVLRFGGLDVVVCEWMAGNGDPQLYRAHGIEPTLYDLVVVKASTSFRAGYSAFAGTIVETDTPGAASSDLINLPFARLPGRSIRGMTTRHPIGASASHPSPDARHNQDGPWCSRLRARVGREDLRAAPSSKGRSVLSQDRHAQMWRRSMPTIRCRCWKPPRAGRSTETVRRDLVELENSWPAAAGPRRSHQSGPAAR